MKNKKIKILTAVVVLAVILAIILVSVYFTTSNSVEDLISIPRYKIDRKNTYIVDKTDSYLGHPDLVLTDSGKLITVYPSGHGKGAIIAKTSIDMGKTWSDRLTNTPQSWETSQETPILYKIELKNGNKKIILTSGCPYWPGDNKYKKNGFNCSISTDDGETFSEFTNWYGIEWASKNNAEAYDPIVAMSSLTRLKENGEYVDKWLGTFHDHKFYNYYSILTFDENENPVWSKPELLLKDYHKDESKYGICEIEIVRDPKTDTLILLARANKKVSRSLVCFSDDEGKTWTKPKELPYELTGERHKAEYDETTGKLIVSFRQVLPKKPNGLSTQKFVGNQWVCWVGTFEDILSYKDDDVSNDKKGDFQIILGTNNKNSVADNGYSGTAVSNGEFVLVSYGYFDDTTKVPFIISCKFKIVDFLNK